MKSSELLMLKKAVGIGVVLAFALWALMSLASCDKRPDNMNVPWMPQFQDRSQHIGNSSETLQNTDFFLMNNCYPENVHILGQEKYLIKTFYGPHSFFIDYKVDFTNIYGIGEVSGLIYNGKGYWEDISAVSLDSADQRSYGSQTYKLTLATDQGNEIIVNEKAKFVMDIKGNVLVDFQDYADTCK